MTEHKHASVLRAIADGKRVQYRANDKWMDSDTNSALMSIGHSPSFEWRIAPDTMRIGSREVERPSGRAPDGKFFRVSIDAGELDGSEHYAVFDFPTDVAGRAFYDALNHIATHGDQIDKAALIERAVHRYAVGGYGSAIEASETQAMFEYCLGDATRSLTNNTSKSLNQREPGAADQLARYAASEQS